MKVMHQGASPSLYLQTDDEEEHALPFFCTFLRACNRVRD